MLGEVCVDDVDIGTVAQLSGCLLLGSGFVANQTNDQVVLVVRELLEELELGGLDTMHHEWETQTHPDSPGHSGDSVNRHVERIEGVLLRWRMVRKMCDEELKRFQTKQRHIIVLHAWCLIMLVLMDN